MTAGLTIDCIMHIATGHTTPTGTLLSEGTRIRPMLAVSGALPLHPERYGFEYKWDGIRCVASAIGGKLRLESRNGLSLAERFPELMVGTEVLLEQGVVLDGEIVTLDDAGRPSFSLLQQRMHLGDAGAVRRAMTRLPALLLVFDILAHEGRSTMSLPYAERRALLEEVKLPVDVWQRPGWVRGDGERLFHAAEESGLEGIVAKRLDGTYLPGRRSDQWVKIKVSSRQEFVVGGYMPGRRGLVGVGSLLLGYYDRRDGRRRLRYAGRVGTGMSAEDRRRLAAQLDASSRERSPFDDTIPRHGDGRKPRFAKPKLVVEVSFSEWTPDARLRHPVFRGVRADKDPGDVVREGR